MYITILKALTSSPQQTPFNFVSPFLPPKLDDGTLFFPWTYLSTCSGSAST